MCLAVPSKVVFVQDGMAVTECLGVTRTVSLMLLSEPVALGDYVLIQAGGFAFERLDAPQAEDMLAEMQSLLALGGDGAMRQLGGG